VTTPVPLMRQSERATFKRCNWKWYQIHVNQIRPIVEKYKDAADFGTLFHLALAEYYIPGTVRGPHPAETWEREAKGIITKLKSTEIRDDETIVKWEDFYQLGLDLANAYVERYKGDPHWEILDAERRFTVNIPDIRYKPLKSEKGKRGYRPIVNLVGTIDLVFRDLNTADSKGRPLVKLLDHKTVGRIETHHLTLDEQCSTYSAVGTHELRRQGLIEQDEVVKGMEYNFVKRAALDTRPRDDKGRARNKPVKRHYAEAIGHLLDKPVDKYKMDELEKVAASHGINVYGDVSADQSGDNFYRIFIPRTPKERQRQIERISQEALVMNMVRTGELPVLKTPTKDCYFCEFFQLCELDESGGDTEYFIETTMKKVDMYADHREGADNSKKVSDASSTA
jgi:hypothetical protein